MAIPITSWDETNPGPGSPFIHGDNRIRELKTQFRELFEVGHTIEDSGNGDSWGTHSAVDYAEQSANPTVSTTNFILFSKKSNVISDDIAELNILKSDGSNVQLTQAGQFIAGYTNDIRIFNGYLINIPFGWSLCDGNGGRPNLTNRFVRGISTSTTVPGSSVAGGSVTLSTANLPAHSHTPVLSTYTGHTHDKIIYIQVHTYGLVGVQSASVTLNVLNPLITRTTSISGDHTHTITDSSTYSNTAKTISPPYYEVAFIIKT